jgi:hypothetical protein
MMTGPPELPELQISQQVSNQVWISYGTFTNCTYQMQTTTNLQDTWNNTGAAVAGNGGQALFNCNFNSPVQFFRVAVQH